MRKTLMLALFATVAVGCDLVSPEKSRSVELHGQILDAQTRVPIEGALWGVSNTCGFGTLMTLAQGQADPQGRFVARYEYPICGDPFLTANAVGYVSQGGQVFGRGYVVIPPTLLKKQEP